MYSATETRRVLLHRATYDVWDLAIKRAWVLAQCVRLLDPAPVHGWLEAPGHWAAHEEVRKDPVERRPVPPGLQAPL